MSQASNAGKSRLEGFICPACLVDFPSAAKVQDHWLNFHTTSTSKESKEDNRDYEEIVDVAPSQLPQVKHVPRALHSFKTGVFQLPERCEVCSETIRNEGLFCDGCGYACHKHCDNMVKSRCPKPLTIRNAHHHKSKDDLDFGYNPPKQSPKGFFKHLQHIVSKGRVRHVDHEFDLDLTYITERIIAMSFPGTGLESTYRNNLRDVAKMLQSKHQDKYMVFNLSERRYDISKLNHQVLDFGWPDHLAPPLERLCSIIKSIDSWLKTDAQHVVVVHCKGGKGRTGVVISAYMHFSKMCSSPDAALDWFGIKRFYDDKLGGVTQPSQRRYVHYFSDYLEGKIKLSAEPMFLHHVIVHGIPNFDGKEGCKPFLRVYDGLKLVYTSGVFHVTQDMERICITIEGGLILHGDVLIKCYHKNTLSSVRDMIFRCQFHTGAIVDHGLVLDKSELDEAYRDKRFPDSCKVEFVFSATGSFVAEIKDDMRLQSIIRHSLQPVENPDTVLVEDEWSAESASSAADTRKDLENPLNSTRKGGYTTAETDFQSRAAPTELSGPAYVPGPIDGSLYAQVDKNLKKQIRSYSLDSGIHTRAADPYDRRAHTLGHTSRNVGHVQQPSHHTATLNRLQFQQKAQVRSDTDLAMESEFSGKILSIDKLLRELGECSDLLDSTIQQGKKASERPEHSATAFEEISLVQTDRQEGVPSKAHPPTPLRRAASYGATERYQDRHAVPKKLARTMSGGGESRTYNGNTYRRSPENGTSWGGVPGAPRATSTPKEGLQQAPKTKVTPPPSGHLSPKFYATQFVMPYKTAMGQPCEPGGSPKSQAFLIGETVEVSFMNGLPDNTRQPRGGVGKDPADFNNNARDPREAGNDCMDSEPDADYLPERGNVAAKVAYLTEIVFPAAPQMLHPPRKGTVPMPGLVSKSPTEVSDEISKYNATSLAPGELSHSTGTLYRGGVPQTISEHHPGALADSLDGHIDTELAQKLHAAKEKYAAAKENSAGRPVEYVPDSGDVVSADEGIDSKADTDESNAPGSAPSISDVAVEVSANQAAPLEFAPVHLVIAPVQECEIQAEVKRVSSLGSLLDKMEGMKDDEDGYARLDEVRSTGRRTDTTGHGKRTDARPSPILISDVINAQVAPAHNVAPAETEAIDGILSEMADISLQQLTQSHSEAPLNTGTPGTPQTPRSPTSSMSGPFDNTPSRKRSAHHSDKGYSSNTSLSSDSSGADVFLEITGIPGLKFDKDNSQFWYKPKITREQAITILKDKEPGVFVVRDSQSFPGAYGLAIKVAIPPPHVLQGDLTKVDLTNEKIRHFLIESTKKGVKLKGCDNEPVFGSLSAFVFQHTITPLSLPLRLTIPSEDLMPEPLDRPDGTKSPVSPTQETLKVMFVGESSVEMLSGATAVQRTVEDLLKYKATPRFTTASFRVTKEGVTVTDNERKVFFRRHFPMTSILYCGIDPLDQRWDLHLPDYNGKSRTFGVVVRRFGAVGNDCHLFAEVDDEHPVNAVINMVNRYIANPS